MQENPFIKVYWIRYTFEIAQLAINKKQKYFSWPDHQLAENLILVFGFYEGKIKDKSEFVTKVVGIIVTIFV